MPTHKECAPALSSHHRLFELPMQHRLRHVLVVLEITSEGTDHPIRAEALRTVLTRSIRAQDLPRPSAWRADAGSQHVFNKKES